MIFTVGELVERERYLLEVVVLEIIWMSGQTKYPTPTCDAC
jgi:hypothetical protein